MERCNGDLRDEEPSATRLLADDTRVDSAVTPLLLFSVFVAVAGAFACGSSLGYSSPVEAAIMEDLGLTTAQYSLFASLTTVGSLVGNLCSGKISDAIGRRGAMGFSDVLSLIGWTLISVSKEAWSLYVGRFFVGVSMGVFFYAVPVYLAEITPYNLRGGLVSLVPVMVSTGIFVMYLVGSLIPWRILVIIGIVPSLLQLIGVCFIPESPRFLAKRGQNDSFTVVLQRLRGDNIDISQEADDIEVFTENIRNQPEVNYFGLLKREYVHVLVVSLGLMALSSFSGSIGIVSYASSIFESAGFSSSIGSVILAVVQLPSTILSAYLIDKCGRRPLLMISTGVMSLCCFIMGFMFLLKENNLLEDINPYFIAIGLWGFIAAYTIGMAGIPSVIMSEVFSMEVKGSGGSLSVVVHSATSWILAYTFNFMTEWSFSGTFFILASVNSFATLFIVKLVPETKGRTLEKIQESLRKRALV